MFLSLLTAALLLVSVHGDCRNPKVVSQSSYTTGNVLLSKSAAFILEVELDCSEPLSLHGLVGNQLILPLARGIGSNKYQLSWTEDHTTSETGMRTINFYDDERTTSIKKSLRYNEEIAVKPLFSVDMNNKGAKTEFMIPPSLVAFVVAVFVWWLAYTTKAKLQE